MMPTSFGDVFGLAFWLFAYVIVAIVIDNIGMHAFHYIPKNSDRVCFVVSGIYVPYVTSEPVEKCAALEPK
jgi:hypothetical protein